MSRIDSQEWTRRLAAYYADLLRNTNEAGSRHLHDLRSAVRYGLVADLAVLGVDLERMLKGEPIVLKLQETSGVAETDERWADEEVEESQQLLEDPDKQQFDLLPGTPAASVLRTIAALRRIYRKQKSDPFNRETTIGYPVIAGCVGQRRHVGPLLLWNVELSYDPRSQKLSVGRHVENPALNTVLLSKFSDSDSDLDLLRQELFPLVLSPDFNAKTVEEILKAIKGIFGPLRQLCDCPNELDSFSALLRQVARLGLGDAPLTGRWPVLANGPRSFAFLLDDLDQIARTADVSGIGVLEAVVGDVPEEGVIEDGPAPLPFYETADGDQPLWFPLKSNQAQRRAAQKARRARVLTVQGPPGTGKSQTIANLICDLVTRGKTVLVTSHQIKALEVLAAKLPPIEHLAMAVLRGDRESLTRLKSRLEQVQELSSEPVSALRESVEKADEYLRELDRDMRRLDRRYSELKQLEHEEYTGHHRYHEVRKWDRIAPDDRPDHAEKEQIADALRDWADIVLKLSPALTDFETLFRPEGVETTRARETKIANFVRAVVNLGRRVEGEVPEAVARAAEVISKETLNLDSAERNCRAVSQWLRDAAPQVFREVRGASGSEAVVSLLEWIDAARIRGREHLERDCRYWAALASALVAVSEDEARGVPDLSASERRLLQDCIAVLKRSEAKLLPWLLSQSVRGARRELARRGIVLFRATARERLSELEGALRWQSERERLIETAGEFDAGLPLDGLPPVVPGLPRPQLARAVTCRHHAAQALLVAAECPGDADDSQVNGRFLRELLGSVDFDTCGQKAALARSVADRVHQLSLADTLEKASPLRGEWKETVSAILDCVRGSAGGTPTSGVARLGTLSDAYPYYRRLIDLQTVELRSLPSTLRALRDEIAAERRVPDWIERADLALEAHRLRQLLFQSLDADPDDLTAIASRLAEAQERRRRAITEIVRRRRKLAASEAVGHPRVKVELLRFRKLLSRRRKTQSLQTLKANIDYPAALKAFPCWICTIDDVARLFPLKPGLFDVLIVDEASQCSQATALPLAFRAKQMIVVGDRKQLRPASSRFLREDLIAVLQQRHGVAEHPRSVFLNGRDSLIDFAESCAEASDFLNEHFRCDPAIIRWSNEKFYDNRLRIMTRRDRTSRRPPLELRFLTDADDDKERKVNTREAEAVVEEVRRLIASGEAERLQIGVISPYREQARLTDELLEQEFKSRPEVLRDHRIVSSTADGFQGDERDIVLYSFRYGPTSDSAVVRAIELEEERLNVAFTRARKRAVCFVSHSLNRFPKGHIRSFLEHAQKVENAFASGALPREEVGEREDHFDSGFERDVCLRLRDRGYRVTTQEPCAGYFIDLVVEDGEGRQLAVECDGEWKTDPTGQLRPEDYQRQDILERAGWVIHRVSGRRYFLNPERELERIEETLRLQPTARDQAIASGPRTVAAPPIMEAVAEAPGVAEAREEAPGAVAGLDFCGENKTDQVTNLKKLTHWALEHLEYAAQDFLLAVLDKVEGRHELDDSEVDYLRDLWCAARRRGFDPGREELPA